MEYEVRHYRGGKLIEVVGASLKRDGTNRFTFDRPVEQLAGDRIKIVPKKILWPNRRNNA